MHKMKSSLDFQSTKPFLLINKEKSVPSWFGAITTIISFILAFILCISEIKEVKYQTTPYITEDYFYPLSEDMDLSISLAENFHFKFQVYNEMNKFPLDDSIFTPELYIYYSNVEGKEESLEVDLYKCKKVEHFFAFLLIKLRFQRRE